MIDIEKEAKEIEEGEPVKEDADEDIKPAELEGRVLIFTFKSIQSFYACFTEQMKKRT